MRRVLNDDELPFAHQKPKSLSRKPRVGESRSSRISKCSKF
jgi:hypothetical protein